ncbi:MAG TPA: DUF1810 domain-containing protein [Puia sp.]|nr:DUF1810 domain-containing protein [Puia sp.]
MDNSLKRFTDAQENSYSMALSEIQQGRKQSHWMWFIFPQIAGLGFSETSRYYAIKDLQEADEFLKHPVLGSRLINISRELLKLKTTDAHSVFGNPDDLKLKSSMTLFSMLPGTDPVFQFVLEKFFNGEKDSKTLHIIS